MKLSQDMQLIQKLHHDQKRMKKVFEVMSEGTWYPKDSGFELTAFSDADLAGCLDTRKALLEGDHSLGDKLIRWVGWGQLADKVYESLPENGLSILSEDRTSDDTNYVFTMKMEILLESASNKLLVGDLRDSI
ncbi:hypothetical protein Tco_0064436 [Tanacetum coccineum]